MDTERMEELPTISRLLYGLIFYPLSSELVSDGLSP